MGNRQEGLFPRADSPLLGLSWVRLPGVLLDEDMVMTMTPYDTLTDREKDAAVAKALGWKAICSWADGVTEGVRPRKFACDEQKTLIPQFTHERAGWAFLPEIFKACRERDWWWHIYGEGTVAVYIGDVVDGTLRRIANTHADNLPAAVCKTFVLACEGVE